MNKPELTICNRLLDDGFSLLTVAENKQPNVKWKDLQSNAANKDEFVNYYNQISTVGIGIITGYNFLEVVDVDLKVFSTAKERKDFWTEYLQALKDNILDFDKKFVLYRTKNEGYHILYKSKRCVGNKKIASLKGHTEAVIESRGIGGYVFVYVGNNQNKLTYSDIDFVSDADRAVLWDVSRLYDYQDKEPIKVDAKTNFEYETNLKPWDDFNQRNSVLDLVQGELEIVRNMSDKYVVKRFGATSPHSGYVYKDNGFMYLFSTGTIYPSETVITPFVAYTFKHYNGNFSESAKAVYKDGYGERIKPNKPEPKEKIVIPKDDLLFPLEVFPESIQEYITLCNKTLNSSIDYMGCSMLWLMSIIIGNSMQIQVKRGWLESCNLWMCLVGKAGIGKTPSITNITYPLMKVNSREIKKFIKDKDKHDYYKSLSKEEQDVDRKSTRLNSSHGYISYAVFCLKKKKKKHETLSKRNNNKI